MSRWFKADVAAADDPKLRLIARKCGQPQLIVYGLWMRMLSYACSRDGDEWGTLVGWADDEQAAACDVDEGVVCSVRMAMEGRLIEGRTILRWHDRQRRDETANERKRRQRTREKAAQAARLGTRNVTRDMRDVTHVTPVEIEVETESEGDSESPVSSPSLSPPRVRARETSGGGQRGWVTIWEPGPEILAYAREHCPTVSVPAELAKFRVKMGSTNLQNPASTFLNWLTRARAEYPVATVTAFPGCRDRQPMDGLEALRIIAAGGTLPPRDETYG